jgi:hypothetical protein
MITPSVASDIPIDSLRTYPFDDSRALEQILAVSFHLALIPTSTTTWARRVAALHYVALPHAGATLADPPLNLRRPSPVLHIVDSDAWALSQLLTASDCSAS